MRLNVAIVLLHCNIIASRVTFLRGGRAGYNRAIRNPFASMPQPVFHAPDHDHERCTADALKHAEALCAQRAQRLTPIRRQVLELLLRSHKPLGAYEIMDRAAARAGGRRRSRSIARSIFCATTAWCTGSRAATPSSPASTIMAATTWWCS